MARRRRPSIERRSTVVAGAPYHGATLLNSPQPPRARTMSIWVGRYAMVAGEVREHGPWLVERRRTHDEQSVRLLVLADPADEASAEFCHEVADAVAALFGREQLSITGGLLRALRQAHVNLAEWNRRSLREHRVAVGVTCVAISGSTATLAMVGPGAVYVRDGGGVQRLTTAGEPAAHPLGGEEPVEPLFRSVTLDEGRQLLMLSGDADDAVGSATVVDALTAGPERALAGLFLHTRDLRDMTAVLVAELDIDEQAALALEVEVDFEQMHEPQRADSVDSGRPDSGPLADEPRRTRRGLRALPSLPSLRRPRVGGRATAAPSRWRGLTLVAAVVIATVVLGWLVLPSLLREDRAASLEEALVSAGLQLVAAESEDDPAARRDRLQLALTEASRARSIDADDPRVAELQARADAALAALDAVVVVERLERVIDFDGTITAPLRPQALVSGGGTLWLVDAELGRVFAIDPDPAGAAPLEVYRAGERYGGAVAREPLAISWEPGPARLLVLDAGRTLFALTRETPPQVLPLRGVEELGAPAAIAAYAGNLYILDPEGGEVWRYRPAGGGFDSERSGLLGGIEIAETLALAVDGDLFLLGPEGVRHFRLGDELPPLLHGVDRPPQSPAGIVEDPLRGRFYVADRGGRRILLSDRDGAFVQQYRHPDFFDLRGLALSDGGELLYVLTGAGIDAFDPLVAP